LDAGENCDEALKRFFYKDNAKTHALFDSF